MITDDMKKRLVERREVFIQTVLYMSDATPDQRNHSGWRDKDGIPALERWLSSEVARYRKDVHKILGD